MRIYAIIILRRIHFPFVREQSILNKRSPRKRLRPTERRPKKQIYRANASYPRIESRVQRPFLTNADAGSPFFVVFARWLADLFDLRFVILGLNPIFGSAKTQRKFNDSIDDRENKNSMLKYEFQRCCVACAQIEKAESMQTGKSSSPIRRVCTFRDCARSV